MPLTFVPLSDCYYLYNYFGTFKNSCYEYWNN